MSSVADRAALFGAISSGSAALKKAPAPKQDDALAQPRLLAEIHTQGHQRRLSQVGKPREVAIDQAKADFLREKSEPAGVAFLQALDPASLEYFCEVGKRTFSDQACFFLNAFWEELGDQAEVIYTVLFEVMKIADRRWRNIQYIHLYEEGNDLDFDMTLYFFEQVVKFFEDDKNAKWAKDFPKAVPVMMTSVHRKKEIRERVDVNFDGRVSFLEFLLYQYNCSPKQLMERSVDRGTVNVELEKAKAALAEVNRRIREYETEKARLEDLANSGSGFKALGAKNQLAQLLSGPLAEQLRAALIKAEAAVRIVARQQGIDPNAVGAPAGTAISSKPKTSGDVWWMSRDIEQKKKMYGAGAK
jgi:hypothetical protein